MDQQISPGKLEGHLSIPGSKSHSLRALIIAALAEGESRISSPLDSADTRAGLKACRQLGAQITEALGQWIVEGTGGQLAHPKESIDVANSGTTLYLLTAMAALTDNWVFFTGDEQIQNRPVEELLQALRGLGADAHTTHGNGSPPFAIKGPFKGGKIRIACPTSQYLSALLLAAPLAPLPEGRDTEIIVTDLNEKPYVEMTLNWLEMQKIKLYREDLHHFRIPGGQRYTPMQTTIPGDFSSATFFFCGAAITGGTVTLANLSLQDPQGDKRVIYLLEKMGCRLTTDEKNRAITIQGPPPPKRLQGIRMDLNAMPDALPALAAAACFAQGTTEIVNVAQARLKETDRIAVMAAELRKMGAAIVEKPDGLTIHGGHPLTGTTVDGHGDHRVIMALAIAALAAQGDTTIRGIDACAVTYPDFFKHRESLLSHQ